MLLGMVACYLSLRSVSRISALGRKQKFNLRDYRLAEGISRSAAQGRAGVEALAATAQKPFAAALARDLDRSAAIYAVMARELAAAYASC